MREKLIYKIKGKKTSLNNKVQKKIRNQKTSFFNNDKGKIREQQTSFFNNNKEKIREQQTLFYNNSKKKIRKYHILKLYENCNKSSITKWYIERISKAYEVFYPGEKYTIAAKTMKTSILLWLFCIVWIVILLFRNPSFYTVATGILFIVIIHFEIMNGLIKSLEIKLLKQLEKYLSDVRHSYYMNQMVEEAIEDALENCGYEIRIHARKLYDILTSDDPEDELNKYKQIAPNKYLKLFLALSVTVMEYGDEKIDGQSLYLNNIKTLKNDIHIELLKLRETKFRFSGLIFIAVVPVFFLRTIKNWSISNLPELEAFYLGQMGILLSIVIFLSTIISYIMLNQLKEQKSLIPKDHFLLEKLIQIPLINRVLNNYIEKNYGKILSINENLKKSGENMSGKQFLLLRLLYGVFTFSFTMLISIWIHTHNSISTGSKNIGVLLWQEVACGSILSYIAYYFPYWMTLYRRKIAKMNMEDEVIQYQSIIMMLMYMQRVSVFTILEFMENFAVVFKDSLQDCINDYSAGDTQALEELKEKETFEPFKRLVDSLLICDKIGIEKAFDEINSDILYYQDKRKQDNEMNLTTKVVLGKLIAYIPIILSIGFYLIVPFIVESMNQLMEYSNELFL